MKILVDTSIWSLAYRRREADASPATVELAELIRERRAVIIGPVRQEVLSGIREDLQFYRVRNAMRAFIDLQLNTDDYEAAAACYNACRAKGIHGSHTDFIICATAARRDCGIFTADGDFTKFTAVLPIKLHQPRT
jgi:predicted nucleic acid-binding protein